MVYKLWHKTLFATALALSLAAVPAGAVTCSGTGCTGQDPDSTGCIDDGIWITASSLLYNGSAIAHVQLMWSPTCETVWSRLSTYNDPAATSAAHWSWLSNGSINFSTVSSSGVPSAPADPSDYDDYDEVYDISTSRHLDSKMYHYSETRVTNGVKACARITGLVTDKCTVLVDPDDLLP